MTALRIVFLLFNLLISLPTWGEAPAAKGFTQSRDLTTSEQIAISKPVSLINLISTPERYTGKVVAVEGFLQMQYEDERLYLSKENAAHVMGENAVRISYSKSNLLLQPLLKRVLPRERDYALHMFDQKYVLLIGKFSPGNLSEVSRVLELQ